MAATLVAAGACTVFPFSLFTSNGGGDPTALALCDENPARLCVVGFDAQSANQMSIVLYMPPADLREVYVVTTYQGSQTRAACALATDISSMFYCVSAQVPLGSTIGIDVYARAGAVLLAHGDIEVSAFALPTLGVAGLLSPSATLTSRPSPTGTVATTPQARGTPATPTRTPVKPTNKPGTAYPNP